MKPTSKLFDSIRIRSAKGKQTESQAQTCQWDGCGKAGLHKAPAGRNREGQYLYFCLNHIRVYNKNFNYFSNLSDPDISKFQDHFPTEYSSMWSTSSNDSVSKKTSSSYSKIRSGTAAYQNRIHNPFSLFTRYHSTNPRKVKPLEVKAFDTLELPLNSSAKDIKKRYKELIKKHHPDTNGGNRSSEERFRDVLNAYNLLKKSGFC